MGTLIIKDFMKERAWEQEIEDLDEIPEDITKPQEPPQNSFKGQLTNINDIIRYATAGNATLTIKSQKTNTRFTYKIKKPKEQKGPVNFFVSLLNGPNNTENYQYMGQIYKDNNYKAGKKSKITDQAPSNIAFNWFWNHIIKNQRLPENQVEIWHEGTCCRCGRKLTVPTSISNGVGPECMKHMGV